jgi:release factor glutamine methyltransferase
MTVAEAWQAGREHLSALGIEEASITAEVLLRHTLNLSRAELYLVWGRAVADEAFERYQHLLAERARGRPVAYIVGHREFMGLDFHVDERVLIPRPETEVLVETVLDLLREVSRPVIADVGTGSGAIAVSLAVMRRDAVLVATDLSEPALEVARANARHHHVVDRITFMHGDLVEPLIAGGARCDAVVCNPPYVAPEAAADLPREIREFEPSMAVIAPGAGDAVHSRLVDGAPAVLVAGGWLAMEVAAGQAGRVVELLQRPGVYEAITVRRDGLGWERVVTARRRRRPTEGNT